MRTPRVLKKIRNTLKSGFRDALIFSGIDLYQTTEDRKILEGMIFPYFLARPDCSKILFVGCDWYTKGYNKIFRDKDYRTLEIDPKKAKYAAKQHVIDGIENIGLHFDENQFDLIICNGVFGYGLNQMRNADIAFEGCFKCLRPGGVFILGWNDIPRVCPFPPEECESLKLFAPFVFPPLASARHLTATPLRHTYNFYLKN